MLHDANQMHLEIHWNNAPSRFILTFTRRFPINPISHAVWYWRYFKALLLDLKDSQASLELGLYANLRATNISKTINILSSGQKKFEYLLDLSVDRFVTSANAALTWRVDESVFRPRRLNPFAFVYGRGV